VRTNLLPKWLTHERYDRDDDEDDDDDEDTEDGTVLMECVEVIEERLREILLINSLGLECLRNSARALVDRILMNSSVGVVAIENDCDDCDDDCDDDECFICSVLDAADAKDLVWEELHAGDWKDVAGEWREAETVVVLFFARACVTYAKRTIENRTRSRGRMRYIERVLRKVLREIDLGIMLAGDAGKSSFLVRAAEFVCEKIRMIRNARGRNEYDDVVQWRFGDDDDDDEVEIKRRKTMVMDDDFVVLFPILENGFRPTIVPYFAEPISIERFISEFYLPKQPCAMGNFCTTWPAFTKWRDPKYFLENFGPRTVPVEFGSSYTSENWKIITVTFEEFILKHMTTTANSTAYLAQQTLLDQFPKLANDLRDPDYIHACCSGQESACCSRNFWIGPKATVSPPHQDTRDNLFVQICGSKLIRLWEPSSTKEDGVSDATMYAYDENSSENSKLTNTSKAGDISEASCPKNFPLLYGRKFHDVRIRAGQCLFIPKNWWHFVKSESASISVSFWFG